MNPQSTIAQIKKTAADDLSLFEPRKRYTLQEFFEHLPQDSAHVYPVDATLSTFTQAELLAYTRSNKKWLLGGTNIATNFATAAILLTTGGLRLTSLTTASDSAIISPLLLNSVNQSAWSGTIWSLSRMPIFRTVFSLASPTASDILAHIALKKTVNLDVTTDDDQVGVRFSSATNSTGAAIPYMSLAGTDTDITPFWTWIPTSNVPDELSIEIDSARCPQFFVNRRWWASGTALSSAALTSSNDWGTGLCPVIGVGCVSSAATVMDIKSVLMSKLHVAP